MKKIPVVILTVITLIILGLWSPWTNWNLSLVNLFGINSAEKLATLKVKSLAGDIDVLIDGEYKDTAKSSEDFLELNQITPGEHLLELSRKGMDFKVTRNINFEQGIDVVIAYEIGPTQEFSEGHIIYTRKSFTNENNTSIEIYSIPDKTKVSLDGALIGDSPIKKLTLDISGKHKLKFEKAGYDSLEIEVLPDTQQERDRLKSLVLNLEINLFLKPVKVVNQ